MEDLSKKAVRNNAVWCDTICRSHNANGEFLKNVWINNNVVPRFYPNVITLNPHLDDISEFLKQITLPSFTIKDCYNSLKVDKQAYSILFEAEWIVQIAPLLENAENWKIIKTPEELEAWELAWNNNVAEERIFLPTLLDDSHVFFLAKYENEQIISGTIANIASGVIGLSNVFGNNENDNLYRESSFFIRNNISQLPIVGYENEENLKQAKTAGFSGIGKLKVIQIP